MKWFRCANGDAEQYRKRTLCGSIGLESRWSEWKPVEDVVPLPTMNIEYEYRCTEEGRFLRRI